MDRKPKMVMILYTALHPTWVKNKVRGEMYTGRVPLILKMQRAPV